MTPNACADWIIDCFGMRIITFLKGDIGPDCLLSFVYKYVIQQSEVGEVCRYQEGHQSTLDTFQDKIVIVLS